MSRPARHAPRPTRAGGIRTLAATLLLALAGPALARAETLQGTVVRVTDGDSLWFRPDRAGAKPLRVRLQGLDAPERCQPGGEPAREALSGRVLGRRVQLIAHAIDDYQRTVGTLRLDGEDIGAWMVLQGHAWAQGYRQVPAPYARQERAARAARRGVFADPQAQEPRRFRQQHGPCI